MASLSDEVLLKQTRENKLDTNFEPTPYKVVQKDGSALLLENDEGVRKMHNVAHVKKLVNSQVLMVLQRRWYQ